MGLFKISPKVHGLLKKSQRNAAGKDKHESI